MRMLPMNFPNLNETPLQRKMRAWKREDEHQRQQRLKLWAELREKVDRLPALMEDAQQKAEADGTFDDGHLDVRAIDDLLFEIEQLRQKAAIHLLG